MYLYGVVKPPIAAMIATPISMEKPVGQHGFVLVPIAEGGGTRMLRLLLGACLVQAEHALGSLYHLQSGSVNRIWKDDEIPKTSYLQHATVSATWAICLISPIIAVIQH